MNIKSLVVRCFLAMLAFVFLASMIGIAFYMGKLEGALNPSWTAEKAMCIRQDVDIRESPTGYVIGEIPAGEMVWFMKLDLPFAYVAYFDGSAWLEGTIPAFVLDLCGQ